MLDQMNVRWRYTMLYGLLFVVSSAGLLTLTVLLSQRRSVTEPAGTTTIAHLQQQLAEVQADQDRRLLLASVFALLIMLVVSVVLGRAAAGRVVRPLSTITAATRRISADNLHERLAVTGPDDEVKHLADTIDALLERLEESFAAQRRFVADASHELRTPLATMRASLDVAMAKPGPVPGPAVVLADRIRTELDGADRLLEGLLTLARAQHGALDDRTTVSLTALVTDALAVHAAALPKLDLSVDLPGPLPVPGNRVLLARLVQNLIDNAVVHNEPGGWIRITFTGAGLVVETGGAVLDQREVDALGRPFHRLGAARVGTGTGLGLSIARAVAAAHGGSLWLLARPGGGLRATVELPG